MERGGCGENGTLPVETKARVWKGDEVKAISSGRFGLEKNGGDSEEPCFGKTGPQLGMVIQDNRRC